MNNTPYQLDCESLCEWCAKGLPVYVFGEGIGGRWHDLLVPSQKNCTARSRGEFEASLIARAEQAEKDKRIAERAIDKCNLEVAQELAASHAEVRALREALEGAPHEDECKCHSGLSEQEAGELVVLGRYKKATGLTTAGYSRFDELTAKSGMPQSCDCWKSRAPKPSEEVKP